MYNMKSIQEKIRNIEKPPFSLDEIKKIGDRYFEKSIIQEKIQEKQKEIANTKNPLAVASWAREIEEEIKKIKEEIEKIKVKLEEKR